MCHTSKLREAIIDAVMMKLADGPGASKTFLTDNGKEFTNQGFQEMCKLPNMRDFRTAVESPWANDLFGRNHAVVDEMVNKILDTDPNCTLERALAWAFHA